MSAISNDWLEPLAPEFKKPYYKDLYLKVKKEYHEQTVYPPADDIFNAFDFTPLSEVKVVIIGQDPYHEPGQAHGLCFSVKPGVKTPPSLVNIYKELHDDLGCTIPNNGYLEKWARQGVLMLNNVLTVRAHQAASHADMEGIKAYLDELDTDLNTVDTVIKTGNAMADAILNSKISLAQSKDINVSIDQALTS